MLPNYVGSAYLQLQGQTERGGPGGKKLELRTDENVAGCHQFILTAKSKVMQYYLSALLKISKVKGHYHVKNINGCMKQSSLPPEMTTCYPE